jgi:hypothetical protein
MVQSANKTLHWIDHQRGSGGRWSFVRGVQPVNLVVYNAPTTGRQRTVNAVALATSLIQIEPDVIHLEVYRGEVEASKLRGYERSLIFYLVRWEDRGNSNLLERKD